MTASKEHIMTYNHHNAQIFAQPLALCGKAISCYLFSPQPNTPVFTKETEKKDSLNMRNEAIFVGAQGHIPTVANDVHLNSSVGAGLGCTVFLSLKKNLKFDSKPFLSSAFRIDMTEAIAFLTETYYQQIRKE